MEYIGVLIIFLIIVVVIMYIKDLFKTVIEGHGGGGGGIGGHGGIGTGGYGGIRYGMGPSISPLYLDSYYDYDYYPPMHAYPPAAVYYPPPPPLAMRYGQGYGQGYVVPPPNYFPYY